MDNTKGNTCHIINLDKYINNVNISMGAAVENTCHIINLGKYMYNVNI